MDGKTTRQRIAGGHIDTQTGKQDRRQTDGWTDKVIPIRCFTGDTKMHSKIYTREGSCKEVKLSLFLLIFWTNLAQIETYMIFIYTHIYKFLLFEHVENQGIKESLTMMQFLILPAVSWDNLFNISCILSNCES